LNIAQGIHNNDQSVQVSTCNMLYYLPAGILAGNSKKKQEAVLNSLLYTRNRYSDLSYLLFHHFCPGRFIALAHFNKIHA